MRSSLDCIPCFVRQTLEAARAVSSDPTFQEDTLREMLLWITDADLGQSPPRFAQHIHRRLRAAVGGIDPYRAAKDSQNQMALRLLPHSRERIGGAADPLCAAVRLAVAGNAIDLGVSAQPTEEEIRLALDRALEHPLGGEPEELFTELKCAKRILFLADNAGEIAFDRLLVELLGPDRVTVAVRGAPVLNDATRDDARAVGLDQVCEVIDNGSDAPGTILADCSPGFRRRFADSDLIIAKGQGNFESLSEESANIFFLFKAKCQVIAGEVGLPVGTHVVIWSTGLSKQPWRRI